MNNGYTKTHAHTQKYSTSNSHVVSYFQQEAAFIDSGAQWKTLFPGFRVRGCGADDVLPGGLLLARYKKKKKNTIRWEQGTHSFKTITSEFKDVNEDNKDVQSVAERAVTNKKKIIHTFINLIQAGMLKPSKLIHLRFFKIQYCYTRNTVSTLESLRVTTRMILFSKLCLPVLPKPL